MDPESVSGAERDDDVEVWDCCQFKVCVSCRLELILLASGLSTKFLTTVRMVETWACYLAKQLLVDDSIGETVVTCDGASVVGCAVK